MTTPASNVTGIQGDDIESPEARAARMQGVALNAANNKASANATPSSVGIQTTPPASGFNTYQGQGPRTAVTDAGISPTQVTGPGIAETPDFSGVTEEAKAQGDEQKKSAADQTKALQDQAQKSTDDIQKTV